MRRDLLGFVQNLFVLMASNDYKTFSVQFRFVWSKININYYYFQEVGVKP